MARPYIVPFGFIKKVTDDGAIFTLSNADDSANLKKNTPVTVWRYSPEKLALAKIRGIISAVGFVTARFKIVESKVGPRWPEDEAILRERTPVYLAVEGTFEPDPRRMLTQEQADSLQSIAQEYRKLRSGGPPDESQGHVGDETG